MKEQLLVALQKGIPFVSNPFLSIAKDIGTTLDKCLQTIQALQEEKIIRHISPIYDTKMLGYESSLVSFMVPEDKIESTVELINSHPGVSHNYLRNHDFNIWFTLAIPPDSSSTVASTVDFLARASGVKKYAILNSTIVFKIGVKLNKSASSLDKEKVIRKKKTLKKLSAEEIDIIAITQGNMPITDAPFSGYAKKLGIHEDDLLSKLRAFNERGVMRRFAAILNHRKAGFGANGMSIWKIPKDKTIEVGEYMATYKAISHCYERTTNEYWDYNIFSMIHGQNNEDVESVVQQIKENIKDNCIKADILYSSTEFKKKRLTYFSNDYYAWEKKHLQ